MTDQQLYLAIGVPILANIAFLTLALTIGFAQMGKRLTEGLAAVHTRIDDLRGDFNTRFASIEARMEILTGKVAELTDRVTRLEERTERR